MLELFADLLRVATLPVLGFAAYTDLRTRRIYDFVWYIIGGLGALALGIDAIRLFIHSGFGPEFMAFAIRTVASIVVVSVLGIAFWITGLFGGADGKGFIAFSIAYPVYPEFTIAGETLPLVIGSGGIFSLSVLVNTVLISALYIVWIAVKNIRNGVYSPGVLFFALPVERTRLDTTFGTTLNTGENGRRVDLDALKIYARWRGVSLAGILSNPSRYRAPPETATAFPGQNNENDPRNTTESDDEQESDEWCAEAFLTAAESDDEVPSYESPDGDLALYGATAEDIRETLDYLAENEIVWVSPGVPFVVPMFFGALLAFTYGDAFAVALYFFL